MTTATQERPKLTVKDYQVSDPNDWCPGCGDFGILSSLQQALAKLGRPPHETVVVGGIGCSGKATYYLPCYGVHSLHGRLLPVATGIKLANPDLTVVGVGGDGDGLGIGACHFVGAGRRNVDLTYIFFDNEVYGLTKGQASPTLPLGLQTKSLPEPNIQGKLNPLVMALASGYTFIARAYSYDIKQQVDIIMRAVEHPGLAFIDILQPCPTYNNLHTKDYWSGKDRGGESRIYRLEDEGYDPVVPGDAVEDVAFDKMSQFIQKAHEFGDRTPTGVFLENRTQVDFGARIAERLDGYTATPPARRAIAGDDGRSVATLTDIFEEHRVTGAAS